MKAKMAKTFSEQLDVLEAQVFERYSKNKNPLRASMGYAVFNSWVSAFHMVKNIEVRDEDIEKTIQTWDELAKSEGTDPMSEFQKVKSMAAYMLLRMSGIIESNLEEFVKELGSELGLELRNKDEK